MTKKPKKERAPDITLKMYYPQDDKIKSTTFINPLNLDKSLPVTIKEDVTRKFEWAKGQIEIMKADKKVPDHLQKTLLNWKENKSATKRLTKEDDGYKAFQQFMDYDIEKVKRQLDDIITPQLKLNILMAYKGSAQSIMAKYKKENERNPKEHPAISRFVKEIGKLHTKLQNDLAKEAKNFYTPSVFPDQFFENIYIEPKLRDIIFDGLAPYCDDHESLKYVLKGRSASVKIGYSGNVSGLAELFKRLLAENVLEKGTKKKHVQRWLCNWFFHKEGNHISEFSGEHIYTVLSKERYKVPKKDKILPDFKNYSNDIKKK